jgi:ElaB/YqjD/DUF883 family membrane-anchored ribosome-binding protein
MSNLMRVLRKMTGQQSMSEELMDRIRDGLESAKSKANDGYEAAKKHAKRGMDEAGDLYSDYKDKFEDGYESAKERARKGYHTAKSKAGEGFEAAKKHAKRGAERAGEFYDDNKQTIHKAGIGGLAALGGAGALAAYHHSKKNDPEMQEILARARAAAKRHG